MMNTKIYTVWRDGRAHTVEGMGPCDVAARLYPDLRPVSWRVMPCDPCWRSCTVVNGTVEVYEHKF